MVLNSSKTHSCWLKNRLQHFQERRQQDGPAKWPCQWNRAGYHKFFDWRFNPVYSQLEHGYFWRLLVWRYHSDTLSWPAVSCSLRLGTTPKCSNKVWLPLTFCLAYKLQEFQSKGASSPSCNFDENTLKLPASAARQANGNTKDNCKGLTSRFQTLQFQVMTWSKSHW